MKVKTTKLKEENVRKWPKPNFLSRHKKTLNIKSFVQTASFYSSTDQLEDKNASHKLGENACICAYLTKKEYPEYIKIPTYQEEKVKQPIYFY